MSQASKATHGLRWDVYEAHLRGMSMPTPVEHDPDKTINFVVVAQANGAGIAPATLAANRARALRIRIELVDVPDYQFREFETLVFQSTGQGVDYSPLGEDAFTSSGWTLVNTTDTWVETRHGIWSGVVELVKKGGAI